jgi:D-tyrosyl-tRNA(Tyr) deacylase
MNFSVFLQCSWDSKRLHLSLTLPGNFFIGQGNWIARKIGSVFIANMPKIILIQIIRCCFMRAVVQRVKQSVVKTNGETVGRIGQGLLVLLGVAEDDSAEDADYLANKIINLRIFEDENGKMNRSLLETGGELLAVSQFTLLADCRKGRRPSFVRAAEPEKANGLYEKFVEQIRQNGVAVQTGRFQARMEVALVNDGPVTIIIESPPGPS